MNVKIHHIELIPDDRVKAVFSFVLGENELALHDVKLVNVQEKLFLAMPNKRDGSKWKDLVHPIDKILRVKMETLAIEEYQKTTMEEKTNEQSNRNCKSKGRGGKDNDGGQPRSSTNENGKARADG